MMIAAILLAAGDASIDGVPLALLPWGDGTTLIEYQITQLQAARVDVVVVVLGFDAERVIPIVGGNDVEPIVDPRWETGEASSLRVGAAAVPRNTQAAIITHVNEPQAADAYRRLLDEHARGLAAITCASAGGAHGYPLVIDGATLTAVRNVSDEGGLDAIIAHNRSGIALVEMDVAAARIETADDYEAARRLRS